MPLSLNSMVISLRFWLLFRSCTSKRNPFSADVFPFEMPEGQQGSPEEDQQVSGKEPNQPLPGHQEGVPCKVEKTVIDAAKDQHPSPGYQGQQQDPNQENGEFSRQQPFPSYRYGQNSFQGPFSVFPAEQIGGDGDINHQVGEDHHVEQTAVVYIA